MSLPKSVDTESRYKKLVYIKKQLAALCILCAPRGSVDLHLQIHPHGRPGHRL